MRKLMTPTLKFKGRSLFICKKGGYYDLNSQTIKNRGYSNIEWENSRKV